MHGRLIHSGRARLALGALVLASTLSVGMLVARAVYAQEMKFKFLSGNLLLAWIPLLFALAVYTMRARRSERWWLLGGCGVVWFLFFPNAPYLITDLVHLKTRAPVPRWFDLILFMSFAWTGLFLGYMSLYLMQEVVRNWRGRMASWVFAIGMLALGSFGVFLGRFWRWNSWEVLTRPSRLAGDAARRFRDMSVAEAFAFSATFFAFCLLTYVTLYTMTHLHGHLESRNDSSPPPST